MFRVVVAAVVMLAGCVADEIGYSASSPDDCCYYLPDSSAARACLVQFVPNDGTCSQLTCLGVEVGSPTDSLGHVCSL